MNERTVIPADPDQRRQLWRQWIHLDEPRSPAAVRSTVRRVPHSQDAPTPLSSDWLPDVIDAPAGVIHGLKRAIADCLVGGTLPLADRERLIARSVKLGLNRFEANLLIAAVQNRHRAAPEAAPAPEAETPRRLSLGWMLLIALLLELVGGLVLMRHLLI